MRTPITEDEVDDLVDEHAGAPADCHAELGHRLLAWVEDPHVADG